MKSTKILVVLILVSSMFAVMTACGNNGSSSGQSTGTQQTAPQADSDQQATDQAASDTQPVDTEGTYAQETATEEMPTILQDSIDTLIGDWTDVSASDRFAKITKTDSGYQYEDNDGNYPATFADGILKVKVSDSDSDTADVFIDAKTGHMLMTFQGIISEFSKK